MKRFPQNLRTLYLAGSLILTTSTTIACATTQTTTQTTPQTNTQTTPENTQSQAFQNTLQSANQAWQQRLNRTQLDAAIAHWETALTQATPGQTVATQADARAQIHEQLARAYHFLADSHIRLADNDPTNNPESNHPESNHPAMMAAYEKGIAHAEQALTLRDPAFTEKIAAGQPWPEAVTTANPTAIPALYWYCANLGNWALIEGIATQLARKEDIKATMDFIATTQPDFFYGAAFRYLGVYWVSLPFGNDPQKSQAAFTQSLQIAPNYFATHILLAENLARFTQNTTLFNEQLDFVLNTPPDIIPDLEPENTLEQEKARRLRTTPPQ